MKLYFKELLESVHKLAIAYTKSIYTVQWSDDEEVL